MFRCSFIQAWIKVLYSVLDGCFVSGSLTSNCTYWTKLELHREIAFMMSTTDEYEWFSDYD